MRTRTNDGGRPDRGGARSVLVAAAALALAAGGCDGTTGPDPRETTSPDTVPEAQLTFVTASDTAPALATTDTSFVATRGQELQVEIRYQGSGDDDGEEGEEDGEAFLTFELDEESLLRYPDDHPMAGANFQPGDTVTIRIRVATDTLLAEFSPAGLQFDPDEPAELEIDYGEADRDVDDDGEDEEDFEDDIDLWGQERPGEPWFRAGRLKDVDTDEIEADIESFTRFAAAI